MPAIVWPLLAAGALTQIIPPDSRRASANGSTRAACRRRSPSASRSLYRHHRDGAVGLGAVHLFPVLTELAMTAAPAIRRLVAIYAILASPFSPFPAAS